MNLPGTAGNCAVIYLNWKCSTLFSLALYSLTVRSAENNRSKEENPV